MKKKKEKIKTAHLEITERPTLKGEVYTGRLIVRVNDKTSNDIVMPARRLSASAVKVAAAKECRARGIYIEKTTLLQV